MSDSTNEMMTVEGLGQTQQTALAALKGGKSFPQAAEVAGVSRATVYRWVQSDPHFRAADPRKFRTDRRDAEDAENCRQNSNT
jgi:transposase